MRLGVTTNAIRGSTKTWDGLGTWMGCFQWHCPLHLWSLAYCRGSWVPCALLSSQYCLWCIKAPVRAASVCSTETMPCPFVCIFSALYTKKSWVWLEHLDLTWLNVMYYFNTISSIPEDYFLPRCVSESVVSFSFNLGTSNSFHCD